MKTQKEWQEPTIQEIKIDSEISIFMSSTPPNDPFSEAANDERYDNCKDPYA